MGRSVICAGEAGATGESSTLGFREDPWLVLSGAGAVSASTPGEALRPRANGERDLSKGEPSFSGDPVVGDRGVFVLRLNGDSRAVGVLARIVEGEVGKGDSGRRKGDARTDLVGERDDLNGETDGGVF